MLCLSGSIQVFPFLSIGSSANLLDMHHSRSYYSAERVCGDHSCSALHYSQDVRRTSNTTRDLHLTRKHPSGNSCNLLAIIKQSHYFLLKPNVKLEQRKVRELLGTYITRLTGNKETITLCGFAVSGQGFEVEEFADWAAPACQEDFVKHVGLCGCCSFQSAQRPIYSPFVMQVGACESSIHTPTLK